MRLQPGALRFEAVFNTVGATNNGRGTITEGLTEFARAFGALEEIYGGEWKVGPAFQGVQTHWFRCRYTAGVTSEMVAVIDAVQYKILAPPRLAQGDGRSGWMEVRLQRLM